MPLKGKKKEEEEDGGNIDKMEEEEKHGEGRGGRRERSADK